MPFEALRFIHASNVYLDHQLQDPGTANDEHKRLLEDATTTAFERLIDHAVQRQVDFLLLTGNTFVEAEHSLRARVVLLNGFRKLAEHDIEVFVVPGAVDPPFAWKNCDNLPENVVQFSIDNEEPVAVLRGGHVIASIAPAVLGSTGSRRPIVPAVRSERPRGGGAPTRPFAIGLFNPADEGTELLPTETSASQSCPSESDVELEQHVTSLLNTGTFDYLAVGCHDLRRTWHGNSGLSHSPGCPQGRRSTHAGPHGCTLVEVDAEGTVNCHMLPVAAVRWVNLAVEIEPETSQDDLLMHMLGELQTIQSETVETLWLVKWMIRGCGPLWQALQSESLRNNVLEFCELEAELPPGVQQQHRIRLQSAESVLEGDHETDWLPREYMQHLQAEQPLTRETLSALLQQVDFPDTRWSKRLQALSAVTSRDAITHRAQQLGIEWFGTTPEEEAAA